MDFCITILAQANAQGNQMELRFLWDQATLEGKAIIIILAIFSIFAWSVMVAKSLQMRNAKRLNGLFDSEFRNQKSLLSMYERRVRVEGCPLFSVYMAGCIELDQRLKGPDGQIKKVVSIKSIEHIKRSVENTVAREALRLESGLIMLAVAVSGAPFLGLLGTVWGVMSAFSYVAMKGHADLMTMAPGVAAALITTVAGLLVAIPSMFGYNWLIHNLKVNTVELDNFAQEFASRMETEYLKDDES